MCGLGNAAVAALLCPADGIAIDEGSSDASRTEKDRRIAKKYALSPGRGTRASQEALFAALLMQPSEDERDGARLLTATLAWLISGGHPDAIVDEARGAPPLLLAAARGRWDVCALLLLWSATMHAVDASGATILHYMAGPPQDRPKGGEGTFLVALARRGIDMHARDAAGWDALALARRNGHDRLAALLAPLVAAQGGLLRGAIDGS